MAIKLQLLYSRELRFTAGQLSAPIAFRFNSIYSIGCCDAGLHCHHQVFSLFVILWFTLTTLRQPTTGQYTVDSNVQM